jgi:hypothetical protein
MRTQLKKKPISIKEIRQAVADYMYSEGCSCCRDKDAHEINAARLAKLLKVPMYDDKSGYDFSKFRSDDTTKGVRR